MNNYIDAFAFPIPSKNLDEYKRVAEKVAAIWKEHGAISYSEFVGDDLFLDGTRSFLETIEAKNDEEVIVGWVVFPSKEIRDKANKSVPKDPRMEDLVKPLIDPNYLIFDATRMIYGGFKPFIDLK